MPADEVARYLCRTRSRVNPQRLLLAPIMLMTMGKFKKPKKFRNNIDYLLLKYLLLKGGGCINSLLLRFNPQEASISYGYIQDFCRQGCAE